MADQKMLFLNSKAKKEFFKQLSEQYGYTGTTDVVLFEAGNDKFYLISRGIEQIPFEEMRIVQSGLYVTQKAADGLRLSMDGAILFGKDCTAPKIVITPEQRDKYMKGGQVEMEGENTPWSIVMCENDSITCSKIKNGWLLNFVPKTRWILDPHSS